MTSIVYVICEGESEEAFVNILLNNYVYENYRFFAVPLLLRGTSTYKHLVRETRRMAYQKHNFIVTSMVDFYGLKEKPVLKQSFHDKMALELEEHYFNDVGCQNFIPYISMHEYEAIYFSNPSVFSVYSPGDVGKAQKILQKFGGNPEAINGGETTAPSKRIKKFEPRYRKKSGAKELLKNLTIPDISNKCHHFSGWIQSLEERIRKLKKSES